MLESLNAAVDYIEAHLDQNLDFSLVAKAACSSQSHFQRVFVFVTGIPLSEYIRRRRLTLAALELRNGSGRVIDVALKYGYNSADSFARAFQGLHGIVPSKARSMGVNLKAYPRITFTLSIKGVTAMNYRFEEQAGFKVVGVKKFFTTENGQNFKEIPKMWCEYADKFDELLSLADAEPTGLLGVCADMYDNGFDYWIAVSTTKPCPPHFSAIEIPASTWAVFEATGPMPGAIQEMFKRIYSEWLPTSGYNKNTDMPEIEWYSDGDMSSESYKSEVWIPVVKKQ